MRSSLARGAQSSHCAWFSAVLPLPGGSSPARVSKAPHSGDSEMPLAADSSPQPHPSRWASPSHPPGGPLNSLCPREPGLDRALLP